jgi:predicted nucleic acid-binding protein
MRIYFDMCSLQRPLDTKTQIRVAVEAEAILNVISLWEAGQFELVSSQALMFEAEHILEALSKADLFLQPNKQIEERAQVFVNSGIKPLDALHLAFSVEAEANYFCTCDDRFLRRAKEVDTLQTKVVSPLELITELSQ